MSLVICIKDKDRFIFGADKQASTANNKNHDAIKIWELPDLNGALMGAVGQCRASQIIQYSDLIDWNAILRIDGIDTEFVIREIVPKIVLKLRENGIWCGGVSDSDPEKSVDIFLPNSFLFAIGAKAFLIWNDLSVVEIEDTYAIGSGSDVANGALFATKGKDPFERIVTCIHAAAESTLYVDHHIDFLATKTYPKDERQIRKALGIPEPVVEKPAEKKTTTKKKTTSTKAKKADNKKE